MSTNYLMFGEETLQVYKEEADNNQLIRDRILANNKAIQQIQTQLNEDVKRAIEGLTGSLEKKDNSGNEIEELRKQEQQLQQDLKDVEKHNQELSAQCQESQNNVEKLKKTKMKLQEDKDRLDNETTVILPKRREEISLYQNISRVRFDFEDSSKNIVKGYIANKKDVTPFCFDRTKNSEYFIANALWDSMKEED